MRTMIAAAAFALSAGLAGAALAEVATPTAAPLTTEQQIDAFLRTSPAVSLPSEAEIDALQEERARQVHGEVSLSVGSRGYRDAYARSDIPVGKTGTLSLAVRDTRFNGRFGGAHHRQGMALGLALGDAATRSDGRGCRRMMDQDAPVPGLGRDDLRCEMDRVYRPGLSPLDRPMF